MFSLDKSEIGTVVNYDQDDKLFFAEKKTNVDKPPPTSKRRAKAQTKFAEAIKELKSESKFPIQNSSRRNSST